MLGGACSNEISEISIEVLPDDAEMMPKQMYMTIATSELEVFQGMQWRGYTSEHIAFGVYRTIIVCHPYGVEQDDIIDAIRNFRPITAFSIRRALLTPPHVLSCVQSASVLAWQMVGELDAFEQSWLQKPLGIGPSPNTPTCAVASNFRDAPCLSSWVRYHLAVGFDHIFLYVDCPKEDAEDALAAASISPGQVTVVHHNDTLRS